MNPSISSVREVEVECSDQALWESHSSLLIHYYDAASLVTFFFSLYLSLSHCATRGTCESKRRLSERSVCMSSRPVTPLSFAARRQVVERMAPFYREASLAQKALLLDQVVLVTGYARKYAIGLLNRAPKGTHALKRPRPPRYGHEVQHALVQAWKAARHICAKRLIPFLPTLVAALEHHGHLHLSEETRRQLLSMSPATADRVLRTHRTSAPRGVCTTTAGILLKEQIPIRTFQQWDTTRPGFLEANLVAHCGEHTQGSYLYTLTLTDVATGWTECLPVLSKSPEAVLSAFQQARALFPFPILGLDVDNGGEFINALLMHYCQTEQITFTRGREDRKRGPVFCRAKERSDCAPVCGSWPPGWRTGLSAAARTVSSGASVCQLLPTLHEGAVQTSRRGEGATDLRCSQDAVAPATALRDRVPSVAAATA